MYITSFSGLGAHRWHILAQTHGIEPGAQNLNHYTTHAPNSKYLKQA